MLVNGSHPVVILSLVEASLVMLGWLGSLTKISRAFGCYILPHLLTVNILLLLGHLTSDSPNATGVSRAKSIRMICVFRNTLCDLRVSRALHALMHAVRMCWVILAWRVSDTTSIALRFHAYVNVRVKLRKMLTGDAHDFFVLQLLLLGFDVHVNWVRIYYLVNAVDLRVELKSFRDRFDPHPCIKHLVYLRCPPVEVKGRRARNLRSWTQYLSELKTAFQLYGLYIFHRVNVDGALGHLRTPRGLLVGETLAYERVDV